MAAASAAATTAENTAVTTPEAMVDQTFYEDNTTKGTKSQGLSKENTADFEKVRKSAEETPEKARNIPERGEKTEEKAKDTSSAPSGHLPLKGKASETQAADKTTAREEGDPSGEALGMTEAAGEAATPSPQGEGSVKKRGGRNVFRDEKGEYREIAGISDDGAVILDGSAELDVDSLDDETRSAVDTILADLYSGRITEAEAVNMLRNGTLAYVKGDASKRKRKWYHSPLFRALSKTE